MVKQKIRYRNLTEEDIDKYKKGKEMLQKEIGNSKNDIEGLEIDVNFANACCLKQIKDYEKELKEYTEKKIQLAKDKDEEKLSQEDYEIENNYIDYLIKKLYYNIEKGAWIHFKKIMENVEADIKKLNQIINTNELVIKDIDEKLSSGKIRRK